MPAEQISVLVRNLVTRGSETTEWPTSCTDTATGSAVPFFDDRDAEQLFLTLDYTPPDPASSLALPAALPSVQAAGRAAGNVVAG